MSIKQPLEAALLWNMLININVMGTAQQIKVTYGHFISLCGAFFFLHFKRHNRWRISSKVAPTRQYFMGFNLRGAKKKKHGYLI